MRQRRKASTPPVPFGAVIAERRLNSRDAPRHSIVVSLGKARKTKGSDDWQCPFRIAGTGIRKVEYGYGVDAFQALMLALEGIRYFLDETARCCSIYQAHRASGRPRRGPLGTGDEA
jgi:hypothetical protein